jgi:hypothetical protein
MQRHRAERLDVEWGWALDGQRFRLWGSDALRIAADCILRVQVEVGGIVPQKTPCHHRVGQGIQIFRLEGL